MKIAYFTDSYFPYVSGVTLSVANMARQMVKQGHSVMIFRPAPDGIPEPSAISGVTGDGQADGVTIQNVCSLSASSERPDLSIAIPTVFTSYVAVSDFQPDIVHVHTEWGCGWEGVLCARLLDVPVVSTAHTLFASPQYMKQLHLSSTSAGDESAMWDYMIAFHGSTDLVICPGRHMAEQMVKHGLQQSPVIVSNSVCSYEDVPEESLDEQRVKFNLPVLSEEKKNSFVFMYVGRLSAEKSLDTLLASFRTVLATHHHGSSHCSGIKLLLIGKGPERVALEKQCRDLNINGAVIFAGEIEHGALMAQNVYRVADAFVTASVTENQPVTVIEAMSFAVPCIGPRAAGMTDVIEHEHNGLLFSPGSVQELAAVMNTLVSDKQLRHKLSANARLKRKQCSAETVAIQQLEHYRQVISRRRAASFT